MGWWILSAIVTAGVIGYIAHKYPTWFGKAVADSATVVNSIDDKIKQTVSKSTSSSNTAS